MKLAAGCAIAALGCAVLHWMPLAEPHKRPNVPRRIAGYTTGVTSILLGLAVATDYRTAATALTVATAAGAATVGAYAVDVILNNHYGRVA